MFERLRAMFVRPKLSNESRDFITQLAQTRIWILAIGIRGTPPTPDIADPAWSEAVAAHRVNVSELGDDDSVLPFNYDREGRQVLPFFTSCEGAEGFAANKDFPTSIAVFQ